MRAAVLRGLFGVAVVACIAHSPHVTAQALNTNLIVNPGAEASAGAEDFTSVSPPSGWSTTSNLTAVQYAIGLSSELNSADSAAIGGGNNYFAGGPDAASSSASQTISLAGLANSIDAGQLQAILSGYLGGFGSHNDVTTLRAVFRNGASATIGSVAIGPVPAEDRGSESQLLLRSKSALIPAGTRSVKITLLATRKSGSYNDGYADKLSFKVAPKPPSTPVAGTFYWTTFGASNAYGRGSYAWDGVTLSAATLELGALPGFAIDGSNKVGSDGNIYSGRAGSVYQIKPALGTFSGVRSGVNNNVTSIDPAGTTVYVGGKDTPLATLATGGSFGPGTAHGISGDDTAATGLAWDNKGKVWYATGGENVLGNVGKIDLATFATTRLLSGISATSITFDPFTGHLFTAGINGIAQINPATGKVVSTWLNPRGAGLFIQNLSPTGKGHLIAFDDDLVRIWDFSKGSGLIGNPDTLIATASTPLTGAGLTLANVSVPPVITSPLKASATKGQQFVYQFEATDAASLSVLNLPAGLSFDTDLSAIVGKPTVTGTFNVTLEASNVFATKKAVLVLSIKPPPAGPVFINSTSATGRTGQPFTFQLISTGASPRATVKLTGLPAGLTFNSVDGVISGTPTEDGGSSVVLTITDGNTTATATLQLTFSSDPALPVITSPSDAHLTPGQPFTYQIVAPAVTRPSDPTQFTLLGTLPAGLGFDPSAGTISGSFAPPKREPPGGGDGEPLSGGVITNVQLFATNSTGTSTLPLIFYLAPKGLVNIATRLSVGSGDNVLITGFILTGNAPKKVILRALGPSLKVGEVPLAGRLPDPTLDLYDGSTLLGSNDNWRSDQEDEILGTSIPPPDDREAAAVATLAAPGSYTAVVRGKGNSTGFGVVELYDLGTASLDTTSNAQLVNLSTRGLVQKGDNILIGGFIVSGEPTKVIVRAIGPSLNSSVTGALQDPTLSLVDGNGAVVKEDDNWRTGGQQQEIINSTVPPSDDRESAVVATLNPGGYTAVVRGSADTTGVAVVEVYVLK